MYNCTFMCVNILIASVDQFTIIKYYPYYMHYYTKVLIHVSINTNERSHYIRLKDHLVLSRPFSKKHYSIRMTAYCRLIFLCIKF